MSLTDSYKQRLKQLNSNPSAPRSSSSGKSTGARSAKSSLTDSYKQRLAQLAASGQIEGPKPATFSELRQSSAKMLQQQSSALQAARKEREKAQNTIYKGEQSGRYNFDGDRGGTANGVKNFGKTFSPGEYAAGIAEKGVHQIAKAGSSTLAFAEGLITRPIDYILTGGKENPLTESGFFHKLNEDIDENVRQAEEKYAPNVKAGGKAAQVVEDLGVATVAAIPQAAVAMMTGGAGAAEKGIEVARRAPGVFSTLRAAVSATAKNPMFWSSYFQTVGNEYETAKEDGAGETAATLYALSIGAMNAAVEVGGGIETLPTELQGNRFTVKKWIESMVDEGKEEVVQGIISRAGQNLFYGKNNPLVSVADQDAVLNPVTAAQEFAGGAVVGGILVGAQGVAANILNGAADSKVQSVKSDSAVQKAVDKAQTARYDKNVETAEATVLNRAASLYLSRGLMKDPAKAEAKAKIIQDLIDGKNVSNEVLKQLNLSDAKFREVFTELTGVVFPEGVKMSDDQRFNLARTAKDVAQARAQAEKLVAAVLEDTGENSGASATADTTQPENATQGVQEAAEAAELRDPDNGPADYEHFAQAYLERVNPEAEDTETRAAYEVYLRDSETITTQYGPVTRAEFRTMMRQSGQDSGMTDEQLNAFFDYVRENENRGGAPMFNTSEEDAQNGGAREENRENTGGALAVSERDRSFSAKVGKRGQAGRVSEGQPGTDGEGKSRLGSSGPVAVQAEEDAQNGGADEAKQSYPGRELSEDERRTPFAAEAGERGQTVRVFEGAVGSRSEGRPRLGRFTLIDNPSETAAKTVTELEALGVPAFVHAGDLELLSSNGTVLQAEEDAATVNKAAVGVADSIDIPPKETAGHEAYHFKDGLAARVEYDAVVSTNVDVGSDAFSELFEHIEDNYFDGDYDNSDKAHRDKFNEELRAYVSGYIHNNSVPDGLLIDEAEVRESWEKLIESGKGVSKDGEKVSKRAVAGDDAGGARRGVEAPGQDGERTQSPGERRGRSNVRDAGERVQGTSEAEGRVQGEGRELNRVPEGAAEADGPAEAPSSIAQRFHSWEGAYLYMEDQGLNMTFEYPPHQARLFGEITVGYNDGKKWVDLGVYDLGAEGLAQFKSDFGNLLAKSDPGFTAANQVSTVKKMIAGMEYDVLADPEKMGFEKAVKDAQRVGMTLDVVNDKSSFRKSDGSYVAGVASPEGYILTTRDVKSADHEVMHGYLYADHGFRNKLVRGMDTKGRKSAFDQAVDEAEKRWGAEYRRGIAASGATPAQVEFELEYALQNEVLCEARAGSTSLGPMMKKLIPYVQKETAKWEVQWDAREHKNIKLKSNPNTDEIMAYFGMEPGGGEVDGYADFESYTLPKNADPMYSYLLKTVLAYKGDKLGASSVVPYLRGRGVKAEEIKWSGLENFLEGKRSVTKDELAGFLRENALVVNTETLGDDANNGRSFVDRETGEVYEDFEGIMDEAVRRAGEMGLGEEYLREDYSEDGEYYGVYAFLPPETRTVVKARLDTTTGKMVDEETGEVYSTSQELNDAAELRFAQMGLGAMEVDGLVFEDEDNPWPAFALRQDVQMPAQIRGPEDLKDLIITIEARRPSREVPLVSADREGRPEENGPRWGEYKTEGGENYREYKYTLPGATYTNDAMQVHWGQKGVLAHARVQDIRAADGKKTLLIEEIQSDWHNAGQKSGYATEDYDALMREQRQLMEKRRTDGWSPVDKQRYDEIGALLNPTQTKVNQEIKNWTNQLLEDEILSGILDKLTPDIIADNRRFGENIDNDTARQYAVNKLLNYSSVDDWLATDGLKVPLLTEEESARLDEFYTGLRSLNTKQTESLSADREIRSRPPEAPFSKNYHEFVLKKLLREAAENGYEYLAWTTADMQSERWSNEFAEGYRIEYDQDIPKFLNKYGKQWGARVGLMELNNYNLNDRVQQRRIQQATEDLESWQQELELAENESQRDFIREQISYSEKELAQLQKKGDTVWYIPITQEMRNSVLYEGQPMFNMPHNADREALAAKFNQVYGDGAAEALFAAADKAFSKASEEARLNPPTAPASQGDGEMIGWVTYGRSVGSAALRFDPYSYLQNEYGTIEQTGRNNARIVDVPKSTNGRDKVSKTTATVMGAKATPDGRLNEIASAVVDGKLSYYPTTNKIAENKARARIRKVGFKDALAEWTKAVDSGKVNSDLVAMGATLLNNAGNSGEVNGRSYTILMAKYAQLLRSAGQALQAANIFQKMTPEAKLYTVVRQVEEINARHDTGLPVSMWMDQIGELLADEIYKRIDVKESRERVKTVADTILEDLTNYAKDLVVRESVTGASSQRTELERLQDMFNNRANYEEAWQVAKNRLVDEFGADANTYAALESWINSELTYADKLTKILTKQNEIVMPEALAEEYLAADTDEARDEVMDRILQSIADQIPATGMDKFTALRHTGMLGNLRSVIRNTGGNVLMQLARATKIVFASLSEALVQKAGLDFERTTSLARDSETLKVGKTEYDKVKDIIASGGKYQDNHSDISQEIRKRQRIFKNAYLEGLRKGTGWLMDNRYFGDAAFSSFTFTDSLARYISANGTTWSQASEELKERAVAHAIREAAEATYRDNNALSEAVSKLRFRNPKTAVEKGINLVAEGLLPFRKTPANILARAVEYSPIGFVNAVRHTVQKGADQASVPGWAKNLIGRSELTVADVIDAYAKGATGSALVLLGMGLASMGYLHGKGPDDEKEKELWEMQGHQSYSLEIDGTSYTIDWAAPVSIPLLVGAELHEALLSEGLTVREAASVASAVFDPILEMSMLQGVNDAISNAQTYGDESALVRFVGNALWSYITQPIPTLLGQAERASQNIRMTTYVDKTKDVPDAVQRALGKASAKIPGWDYAQVQYIDAWGRTQKNADSETWNVIEQFLSPGYANTIQETDMEKELVRLKEATGDAGVLIKSAPKYFNVGNERKDLTADEYLVYAKTRGQTAFSVVTDITESGAYSGIDDKQKAAAVSKAYDYANQVAKEQVTNGAAAPDKWVAEARLDAVEYGIPVSSYLIAYAKTKDLKGILDKNGETVDNSKGLRVMAALYEIPGLTDEQVRKLAEDFDVGKTVRVYNANLVKSKLEAMERKYQ